MVLEPDMAHPRHVLVRRIEFIRCAIRVLVRLGPQIKVHINYLLTVQHYVYFIGLAGDSTVIPFAGLLCHFLARRQTIINRPACTACRPIRTVVYLHLDARLHTISDITSANEYATVAAFVNLEL